MSLVFGLLGYRRRWRLLEAFGGAYVSPTCPVVIGGCGSSGTTLLRAMLDRHPAITCGPESTVFLRRVSSPADIGRRYRYRADEIEAWQRRSRSQAEFIDLFQSACLRRARKQVWADKTPENVMRFDFARRHFPRARLVHVIRDGRDVACSLRSQPWMKKPKDAGRDMLAYCFDYWVERVAAGQRFRDDPQYIEVRYEHLVREPKTTMRALLSFLRVDWSEDVLRTESDAERREVGPIYTSAVGRWRAELGQTERCRLERRGILASLGYRG
jgi:protein-tyrosine sulfotransferase